MDLKNEVDDLIFLSGHESTIELFSMKYEEILGIIRENNFRGEGEGHFHLLSGLRRILADQVEYVQLLIKLKFRLKYSPL